MRSIAVIPARWASSRLPGKVLAPIQGRPLVQHVWERASLSSVDRVLVATDDDRVEAAVRAFGGDVVRTGPAASGTHRVADAVAAIEVDAVLNVQCDQLLEPSLVDVVLGAIREGADVATVAAPLPPHGDPADPARVKVVTDTSGHALYFSRAPIPAGGPWIQHHGIYGFTLRALQFCTSLPRSPLERSEDLEQLRWLAGGVRVRVLLTDMAPVHVDTPGQLADLGG